MDLGSMIFPDDVVAEILSWLPVKPIIKFKLVRKGWCSYISSKNFIAKHTKNYAGNGINNSLFFREYSISSKENQLSLCSQDNSGVLFINYFPKKYFDRSLRYLQMDGPINGIFCLYAMVDEITLWNPAIRESMVIPKSTIGRPRGVFGNFVGFGFDSVTSDYKVLQILGASIVSRIRGTQYRHDVYMAEIYSLKTNTWRKVVYLSGLRQILTQYNATGYCTCYGNEIYCWLALVTTRISRNGVSVSQLEEVVLSFDMRNEVFHTTLFPLGDLQLTSASQSDVDEGNALVAMLFSLNDSLALVVSNHPRNQDTQVLVQIWTIKDIMHAEGRSSWTKIANVGPFARVARPLALWRGNTNGNLLLILRKFDGDLVYADCSFDIERGGISITRDIMEWNLDASTSASWLLPNYTATLVSFKIIDGDLSW